MKWHIGCSGFSYKEWKNVFYPKGLPQREWFSYYCKYFSTIELNVTFYRFPQLSVLQSWYNKSPANFLFAVKVPRLITHYKQLNDCERMLADVYNTCREGLLDKLGPMLFQFPPSFIYTSERLDRLLKILDKKFENVVEFRAAGWWNEEVIEKFQQHKIAFCGISYPGLPDRVVATVPKLYYRFHGVPRLYYSKYRKSKLESVAKGIISEPGITDSFCYFNNTAAIGAIDNALWLKSFAERKGN